MELRDYQQRALDDCFRSAEVNQSVMMQLPTGAGKTVVFAELARRRVERGERVLVIAHRQELIEQAVDKLSRFGLPVGAVVPWAKPMYRQPVQVASIQTLVNRLDKMPPVHWIVYDEAHHAVAKTWLKPRIAFPKAKVVGVTATPVRTCGQGFDEWFDDLVVGPSVRDLINRGHLCDYRVFTSPLSGLDKIKINKAKHDYDETQLEVLLSRKELIGGLVKNYRLRADGKRCVVFGVSVAHCETIVEGYRNAGLQAVTLSGKTPKDERRRILRDFEAGRLEVIANCDVISEGLDIGSIAAVQLARPTLSLVKYMQWVGRSLRTSKGKSHAVILDHANNVAFHGMPAADRVWTLAPRKKDAKEWYEDAQKERFAVMPDGKLKRESELPMEDDSYELVELTKEQVLQHELNFSARQRQEKRQELDETKRLFLDGHITSETFEKRCREAIQFLMLSPTERNDLAQWVRRVVNHQNKQQAVYA